MKDIETEYYASLYNVANRYRHMIYKVMDDNDYWGWQKQTRQEMQELLDFVLEILQGTVSKVPLAKINRWIGYVQGMLIAWKITDVQTERDWTRSYFRHLDYGE